jgi:hypothetical protein
MNREMLFKMAEFLGIVVADSDREKRKQDYSEN